MKTNRERIDKLAAERRLSFEEFCVLIATYAPEDAAYAAKIARKISIGRFGKKVYIRGIIEVSNHCRNDCYYCGIRRSNRGCIRYRLSDDEILNCCLSGYELGFRTFVLQGGEDAGFNEERVCSLSQRIKKQFPDCALTLSLGEMPRSSYQKLFDTGADRYLLRHETADKDHYRRLHPLGLSLENRIRCLYDLKEIGYQTGCGMMVGTPGQTHIELAEDLVFMADFHPQMVGIGPFLPHHQTPFAGEPAGSVALTLFLLSLTRIMLPNVLLPATTALGTAAKDGRAAGVLAGCNVAMPNLSPMTQRKKYLLYDNKLGTGDETEESVNLLRRQMKTIGYDLTVERGDYREV